MIDERPLEALLTHTSAELREALAGERTSTFWIRRRLSRSAGEVETLAELLECGTFHSGARTLQLVSD